MSFFLTLAACGFGQKSESEAAPTVNSVPLGPVELAYKFDAADIVTRRYLEQIGVPQAIIDSGEMTATELKLFDIDPSVFDGITAHDGTVDFVLSHDEAARATQLITNVRDDAKAYALFHSKDTVNGPMATTILGNFSKNNLEPNLTPASEVVPERSVARQSLLDAGFSPEELSGLFFADNTMSPDWQMVGHSTVQIYTYGEDFGVLGPWQVGSYQIQYPYLIPNTRVVHGWGSGVVVSQDGTVVTAAHVIYDEDGVFESDVAIRSSGKDYPITENDVVFHDEAADLAVVKVPTLMQDVAIVPAKIAESAPLSGESVIAVGYPRTNDDDAELSKSITDGNTARLYSPGVFRETVLLNGRNYYDVSNRIYPGDSGGGLFNADGELVAINDQVTSGSHYLVSGLMPEDNPEPDNQRFLSDLRDQSRAP